MLSDRYLTGRFLPDKAIDLVDEAASRLRIEIDSMPTEIDVVERRIRQLEIERVALAKETDDASKERLAQLDEELADLTEQSDGHEGALAGREGGHRRHPHAEGGARGRCAAQLERETDLEKAAEIRYGRIPELERRIDEATGAPRPSCRRSSRC